MMLKKIARTVKKIVRCCKCLYDTVKIIRTLKTQTGAVLFFYDTENTVKSHLGAVNFLMILVKLFKSDQVPLISNSAKYIEVDLHEIVKEI